jgi:hypothetical protein
VRLNPRQIRRLMNDGCHPDWFTEADTVELFARDDDRRNPTVALYVNGEDSGQSLPRITDYPKSWRRAIRAD